jgi:thymidylate synthase (FAD)
VTSITMTVRCHMTVELVDSMGTDASIVRAMLVSTQGGEAMDAEASYGRINFLMKNRHGTPFEHAAMTFYIEAPIFVFREFHRHRIGWSYNEMSARYTQLPPMFYMPGAERPLVQEGKPGHYVFVPGTVEQQAEVTKELAASYAASYQTYERLLEMGIAKEMARACLPVATYSAMFATCNPRSLMAFLSLRTRDERSKFPSYPQAEIEYVAKAMETLFAERFPLTHRSFCENGRVSP